MKKALAAATVAMALFAGTASASTIVDGGRPRHHPFVLRLGICFMARDGGTGGCHPAAAAQDRGSPVLEGLTAEPPRLSRGRTGDPSALAGAESHEVSAAPTRSGLCESFMYGPFQIGRWTPRFGEGPGPWKAGIKVRRYTFSFEPNPREWGWSKPVGSSRLSLLDIIREAMRRGR